MIENLALRWFVTALFLLSAGECVSALVAGHRAPVRVVGNLLHVAMAVAMAVMAWPWGAGLPTAQPCAFFLVAAAWFAVLALVEAGHRGVNAYHLAMMLAMAWMYAVMGGGLVAQSAEVVAGSASASSVPKTMPMPGMPDMQIPVSGAVTTPPFITGLNWLCAIGFAVATAWWLGIVVARRRRDPGAPLRSLLGAGCQAMMAAGMALVFGVML
jgi:hypothetical protein